jgi:penicillin amidase
MNVLGQFLLVHLGHPRLIAEPDARNAKAVTRLQRTGFTIGPEITFTQHDGTPKTAQLAFLTRQSFLNRRPLPADPT